VARALDVQDDLRPFVCIESRAPLNRDELLSTEE
jgi:hypothetical protein